MVIPMLDLSEQYSTLKDEILLKLDNVMSSSQFIFGDYLLEYKIKQTPLSFHSRKIKKAFIYAIHAKRFAREY